MNLGKRILAALSLTLALPGCSLTDVIGPVLSAGSLLVAARPAPGAVALDASKLTAANHLAESVYDSLAMAGLSGRIAVSTDQDVARPNFCELVVAELAEVTDEGGRASKLTCLIDHHLDRAKAGLDARDPVAYAEHLAKADTYTNQLRAIVSASVTRTPTS